jgi:hypothetical protein
MEIKRISKRSAKSAVALLCALTLIGVALLLLGTSYAKFLKKDQQEAVALAPSFYFNSDLLSEATPVYDLESDTTTVSFWLQNYADALRYSDDAMQLSVTVVEHGSEQTDATVTLQQSELPGKQASQTMAMLSGLQNGKTYTVTATGQNVYQKTISATFSVRSVDETLYVHLDKTSSPNYVLLTIYTKDAAHSGITITSDSTAIVPDNTYPGMSNVYLQDGAILIATSLAPYSSTTYRFLVLDAINDLSFTVESGPDGQKVPATVVTKLP